MTQWLEFFKTYESFFTALESISTACGVILAIFGAIYALIQLRASQKIAKGEFLLHLDDLLQQHIKVHRKLRWGGEWTKGDAGPDSVDEWVEVEQYMGLFERVKVLIDNGLVDVDTIERLYGYRVRSIAGNKIIHQAKLVQEKESWRDFIELEQALKKNALKKQKLED